MKVKGNADAGAVDGIGEVLRARGSAWMCGRWFWVAWVFSSAAPFLPLSVDDTNVEVGVLPYTILLQPSYALSFAHMSPLSINNHPSYAFWSMKS